MNTSGHNLRISAETGKIDILYAAIQDDPSILEITDENHFAETPLHIAAYRGHLEYAIEIMNLKPSFATKLNLQGHSPIHHAMVSLTRLDKESSSYLAEANHLREMMYKLVGINRDLIRVKGREGLTPLHFACQIGDDGLVKKFINACPDSLKDVTVKGESALHISAKNEYYGVFEILVAFLDGGYATRKLKWEIFSLKDNAGNTVLHISALSSELKFAKLLLYTGMWRYAKNLENNTALDLARTEEMKNLFIRAEYSGPTSTMFQMIIEGRDNTWLIINSAITEEQRNTWLIIATLVATVTYESALSPPGGLFQVSASDDNTVKMKSSDRIYSIQGNGGKSILSRDVFAVYSLANIFSFSLSIIVILILTPGGVLRPFVFAPVLFFYLCYVIAMPAVSPTHANTIILSIPLYSIFVVVVNYSIVGHFLVRILSCLRYSTRPTTSTAVTQV